LIHRPAACYLIVDEAVCESNFKNRRGAVQVET
jgi:hypothetical protein